MWVHFWDMHSGGKLKEDFNHCFIEADSEEEAKIIFQNRYGHNPERVTCTCCGDDYSISGNDDLAQLTAYHRNCKFDKEQVKWVEEYERGGHKEKRLIPLDEFLRLDDVAVIRAHEVKDHERKGELRPQGFVWVD